MGQMQVQCDEDAEVECADCEWTGVGRDLHMISDFEERVAAGEICPAGQCPKCGALAHKTESD